MFIHGDTEFKPTNDKKIPSEKITELLKQMAARNNSTLNDDHFHHLIHALLPNVKQRVVVTINFPIHKLNMCI
jgi:hypothetical protein